jgi:DNA-binding MurR/RpiR family transcriptional regulator
MTPPDDKTFLERVRQALPHLHPAERRLGEVLFDFPGEIASYDAQELAKLAKVSKATVSRFVRRLGFENYEHARKMARKEGRVGSRLFLGHTESDSENNNTDFDLSEEKENVDWTFRRISTTQLDDVAAALLSARKVWIIGHRISQSFATYLYWQMTKLVQDIAVIPRGGETLGEHIASMQSDDCIIFFGLRRRVAEVDLAIEEINNTHAKIAYITDEGISPRKDLNWHFLCQTRTASPQFNHASVLALCHQIVIRATIQAESKGRERLRHIEAINERLGSL